MTNTSLKSVHTCFRVVETLVEEDGCGVSELAEQLDMSKSTVFEYLRALRNDGYVVKDGQRYKCCSRFLSLGDRIHSNEDAFKVAKPVLKELSHETESHASLVWEENGYGAVQYVENTDNRMEPIVHLGEAIYLHVNASGKTILANLPDDRAEEILDNRDLVQLTEKTITDREELQAELDKVEEQGYAVDIGEAMEGVGGIAVPILDRNTGDVLAAIALYGTASGNSIDVPLEEYLNDLQRIRNTIEVNLMYR